MTARDTGPTMRRGHRPPATITSGMNRMRASLRRDQARRDVPRIPEEEGTEMAPLKPAAPSPPRTPKKQPPKDRGCVLCVGQTGSGKSSTVTRATWQRAESSAGFERKTQACAAFRPTGQVGAGGRDVVWVDTVGFQDAHVEDKQLFQEILLFLRNEAITHVDAVVWNIIPNVRLDSAFSKQAAIINQLGDGIWANVVIVCKQSMRPDRDGGGALKAAEQYVTEGSPGPQVTGYRYLSDFEGPQWERLESDESVRKDFNVKNDREVHDHLLECITKCGPPLPLKFTDAKCLDCGVINDPRLMPLYCHLEARRTHPGKLRRTHPGGPAQPYHPSNDVNLSHPGRLVRPWYGRFLGGGTKRYSCCDRPATEAGCAASRACCGAPVSAWGEDDHAEVIGDEGCRKRFSCCLRDERDDKEGGCQWGFGCCQRGQDSPGCVETCVKCGRPWGSEADRCFQRDHNVIYNFRELEAKERREAAAKRSSRLLTIKKSTESKTNTLEKNRRKIQPLLGLAPVIHPRVY